MLKLYRPGGTWSTTPTRGVVAQADADGGAQGYSRGSETDDKAEVIPSDDLDVMGPYGFSFIPASGTEYAELDTTAGPAAVAFRVACPVTIAQGESAHWYDANVYALAKSARYIVQANRIDLGATASKRVVLVNDPVNPSAAFSTWVNTVSTALGIAPPIGAIGAASSTATKTRAE